MKSRRKKCRAKNCRQWFDPWTTLQRACSPQCAIVVAEQDRKKAQRKQDRQTREQLKTRSQCLQTAQRAFNRFVRERDKNEPCISCGLSATWGGQWHASHFRSVGAHPELRFEEMNCHKACSICNGHKSGNLIEYRRSLVEKIGEEAVAWLEGPHEPKKYTKDEARMIADHYRKKLEQLRTRTKCSADDCERAAFYVNPPLCQKHYFRMWRNGSLGLVRKRAQYRRETDERGYQIIHEPMHPLADDRGYVYEHRAVVYDETGDHLPDCELCGKTLTWPICHIDHIDNDPRNNDRANLRPLCRGCNTSRADRRYDAGHHHLFTWGEETKTANEWAKDNRTEVCRSTIVRRREMGMSDEEALFAPKKTHNGRRSQRKAGVAS